MKNLILLTVLIFGLTTVSAQNNKKLSRPEKQFEKFWITFKDNYAFFKLKRVNWDSTYVKFRPLITKKTTEKELISVLGQMVEPLKDGHITIVKGEDFIYKYKKPSYFKQEFKGIEKELWKTSFKTLQKNGFLEVKGVGPLVKEENLYYISQTSDIGFIRITRCFGSLESIFDDKKEIDDTKLMFTVFDSILNSFSNTKALIIDLRSNGGGHGGFELASRFAKSKTLTHYKAIRQKSDYENYSKAEPQYIIPHNGVQYLKPIVILTNDKTASSAEDFAVSLYQQDNITVLGTNTSGMLSDMFVTELTNEISFTLSNQVYYSTNNEILEGIGIPVKIEIKNTKQDIESGIDSVIVKAIEILK